MNLELTVNKTIEGPVEEVFDAWLDVHKLSQFMLPAEGMPNPVVTMDPRIGGAFEIIMQVGEEKIAHHGTYQKIDRPHAISFTWNSPFTAEGSVVNLSFAEKGKKRTHVILHHQHFLNEMMRDNHNQGWSRILDQLATSSFLVGV